MGQCHSIPELIPVPQPQSNKHRKCAICLDIISSPSNIYVKCAKCNIFLHTLCALEYKSKLLVILCPVCKRKHTLSIYDNDVYNSELS
jgi:hypothetical protein